MHACMRVYIPARAAPQRNVHRAHLGVALLKVLVHERDPHLHVCTRMHVYSMRLGVTLTLGSGEGWSWRWGGGV